MVVHGNSEWRRHGDDLLRHLNIGARRRRIARWMIVRDEFYLAAIVQNLKTLAKHIWRPMLHEPAACIA